MAKDGRARKGKRPAEGQYVAVPYAMLKSPAWRSLSGAAVKVWFELHTRFHGGNNGNVRLSMNEAVKALGIGKATVQRAFQELQDKGFIALEQQGDWYSRRAHEWRLTTKPMQRAKRKEPATNDWRSWRRKKTGRGSETDPSVSSVVPFQYPKAGCGSAREPVRPVLGRSFGTETEH